MNASLRIDELHLRAPGLTRAQGHQLAEAVAQRLGKLNAEQSRNVPTLYLKVSPGSSVPVTRIADEIVAGIRRRLK
jgi:hypothetical protein